MVRFRDIASAALLRFLPAAALGTIGLTPLLFGPFAPMTDPAWLFLARAVLEQTGGVALVLLFYRRRLGADAAVRGTRTVLVGLFGAAILVGTAAYGANIIPPDYQAVVWTLTGAVAAATMYWPWLRRPSTEPTLPDRDDGFMGSLMAPEASHVPTPTNVPEWAASRPPFDPPAR